MRVEHEAHRINTDRKNGTKKRLLIVSAATVGIITIGGWAAYEGIPILQQAVHRDISGDGNGKTPGIDENIQNGDTQLTFSKNNEIGQIPTISDNRKDIITIGPNNKTIDQAELDTLPSFDEKENPIFIFDLKLPEGDKIVAKKELHTIFFPDDVVNKAKRESLRNYLETPNVPAGSEAIAPIDGRVFVMSYESNGSITPPVGVKITFMGPDGTLWFYNVGLEGVISSEASGILDIQVDAPRISSGNSNGRDWEKGLLVKRGTSLFITRKDVSISRFLQGGANGSLWDPNSRIPGNLQFHTDSSQRLIVLSTSE